MSELVSPVSGHTFGDAPRISLDWARRIEEAVFRLITAGPYLRGICGTAGGLEGPFFGS